MYTLTFCHATVEGITVPSYDERGQEVTFQVEAESKTETYHHPDVAAFCLAQGYDTRIRTVT